MRVSDKRLRYHDLRHSCASILYANGVSLKTIQEVLGHAQRTTTISYTHLYGQEKCAALDAMNHLLLTNEVLDRNPDRNCGQT